jgi:hypothetical protein
MFAHQPAETTAHSLSDECIFHVLIITIATTIILSFAHDKEGPIDYTRWRVVGKRVALP